MRVGCFVILCLKCGSNGGKKANFDKKRLKKHCFFNKKILTL